MSKTYIVDIDLTICYTPNIGGINRYDLSEPMYGMIDKINALYDAGNTIIYWTARGMSTGNIPRKLTKEQLDLWGAKYHELKFNKPSYDFWIDDKAINALDFMRSDNDDIRAQRT